jgi:hypothetical protein
VVLGSNNSAHDICAALWENGADVTMVQRTSTHIAPSDSLMELALGGLYSEEAVKNGIDHHKADLIFASVPYKIMHTFHIPVYDEMKKRDADLYGRLEKAGFMLDFGDDGSGLFMKYLRRGSGYYIDVGASELVANGRSSSRAAQHRAHQPQSVTLTDGTELPADLIVYATGYGSMNHWLADLVSPEVADRVGKVWGLGSGTHQGPGAVGRRAAQHVEAHAPEAAVDPRRQPAPEPPLLAVPVAAAEGALRGPGHAGLRAGAGAPPALTQGHFTAPNVACYEVLQEQSAFLAGVLAGLHSRTGVVGHLSGEMLRPGLKGQSAFAHGLRTSGRPVRFLTHFCGEQHDPALAYAATLSMQREGADLVFAMLDGGRAGVNQACRERPSARSAACWTGWSASRTSLSPRRSPTRALRGRSHRRLRHRPPAAGHAATLRPGRQQLCAPGAGAGPAGDSRTGTQRLAGPAARWLAGGQHRLRRRPDRPEALASAA